MAFFDVIFKQNNSWIANVVKGAIYLKTHEVVVGAKGAHADLLYLHEGGVPSRNIPPRPVLKPAMADPKVKRTVNGHMRKAMVQAMIKGDLKNAENELKQAGEAGVAACKKYITDGTNLAPNAPSTIARKGSSIPLIDTGALLNSITYEIRGK